MGKRCRMFSNNDLIVDFSTLLNDKYVFYAHTIESPDLQKETLQEHTNRCIKYFKKIVEARNLHLVFDNFYKVLFNDEGRYLDLFNELIINTIDFHDLGKINPLFQKVRMRNKIFQNEEGNITIGYEHSIISAILYLEFYLPRSKDFPKEIRRIFRLLTYINAYVISKHHGNLGVFEEFIKLFDPHSYGDNIYKANIIRESYKKYFTDDAYFLNTNYCEQCIGTLKKFKPSEKENSIILFTYEKLLYSLLVASDFYATTEYYSKAEVKFHGTIGDIREMSNVFNNTLVSKNINKYRKEVYSRTNELNQTSQNIKEVKDINILRNELYLDAETALLDNIKEDVFYLEAPTGSGKSNVAFNLSFQLLEKIKHLNKIMYIYPFNTLIEQNLNTIEKIFGSNQEILSKISVVNSVTPILKEGDDYSLEEYERALLDRQFLNYPITLSTHVTLFDIMFGKHKESGFAFFQLANSVIVLDEIQSYNNRIWSEIINFLKVFAKVLNIKIIIMSATLPNLDILSNDKIAAVRLIADRNKYFMHPLFKDRVALRYDLLEVEDVVNELSNRIYDMLVEGNKILVEFITKKTAIEFYKNFTQLEKVVSSGFKIELITGDDSSYERERILTELEESEAETPFLLITTQVIEAGVDIKNIDIGFKDISKLDSEEQFMGRVNRSSKKKGVVYFFDYDNAKGIYKNDVRINNELTLKSEDMRRVLKEKRFNDYYEKVLKNIKKQNESTVLEKNIDEFFYQVGMLNIPLISERMKLIEDNDWSCSVFINKIVRLENSTELVGREVWNEYKQLLLNKGNYEYAEWRIKLSMIKSKMGHFIYQVNKKSSFPFSEQMGEIFYIEDGDQYFEGGKFIREKLESQVGIFI